MIQFLEYLLKSGVCLALFYPVYKYLLSKETFFTLNRSILIGSAVGSLLLPVWTITVVKEVAAAEVVPYIGEIADGTGFVQINTAVDAIELVDIFIMALFVIYLVGVLFYLSKYIAGVLRILQIILESERQCTSKGFVYISPEKIIPFNWFGIIVISQRDFKANGQIILEHELAHVKYGHDFDLLLMNLLTILQWFNPFTRLLKDELVVLHEFQADNRVLNKGIDAKTYQYLLIALGTSQSYSIPVVNNLCSGNFKKRIKMMLKKQSNPIRAFRALLLIPMLAGAVSLFATTEYVSVKSVSNENVGISADKMTRLQAVNAVEKIYQKTRSNSLALKSILNYTKRATGNFETMVYLAQMTYEFRYHTTAFVKIAQYASKAGFETGYFKQLADIAVMKLDETYRITDLAEEVAGSKKPVSPEIDKKIQLLKESAKYKNLDEARNYNANLVQTAKAVTETKTNSKASEPNSKQNDIKIKSNQVITITITKEGTYEFDSWTSNNNVHNHVSAKENNLDETIKSVINSSAYPKDSLYFSIIVDQQEFSKDNSEVLKNINNCLKNNGIKRISYRQFIIKGSTFSEDLQSDIIKHIFQNLRYPQEAKESGYSGKFFIKVRVKKGVVADCKCFTAFEDVKAPMLKELMVVGYKVNNPASAPKSSDINHKAIVDELMRVAKTLSGLDNPEWKNLSGEFAVPVYFTLR